MSEKRFTETISTGIVTDNKTGIEYSCEMRIDDDFLNLVNIIADGNEQLKDKYNEQSVEYEGLEEQVERLLDFKDKVFNLINKKLKEADKGFEQTYDSWYQGQVDALKELKKELQMND